MNEIQKQLLAVVSFQLFGRTSPQINGTDVSEILKEASAQTVFTTVFPFLQVLLKKESPEYFLKYQQQFFGNVMTNTNNFLEHGELHRLMTEHGIDYCVLKGIASAYYYPEASLRDMGDVDFLVHEKDFENAKLAVLSTGFSVEHGDESDSIHIAYARAPRSVWEQHRSINGIPNSEVGERIREALSRMIETAECITLDGAACRIPDAFHHGLIMLLHVISHMTKEGIGLRHLCDWAVFVQKISDAEFKELFEEKLKYFGLWRFAQILTLVSEKYLGIDRNAWAQNPDIDGEQLENLMSDILNGGNFGKKDLNRYREIKYISNQDSKTVDSKNIYSQLMTTLNQKVCSDYPTINKHKILLPIGWIAESGKYLGLLLTGKRKSKNTSAMLNEAVKRKEIYSQMELFSIDTNERK